MDISTAVTGRCSSRAGSASRRRRSLLSASAGLPQQRDSHPMMRGPIEPRFGLTVPKTSHSETKWKVATPKATMPRSYSPRLVMSYAARRRIAAAMAVQAPNSRPARGVTTLSASSHPCHAISWNPASAVWVLTLLRLSAVDLLALLQRDIVLRNIIDRSNAGDKQPVRQDATAGGRLRKVCR